MPASNSYSVSHTEHEFALLYISPYVAVGTIYCRTSWTDPAPDVFRTPPRALISTFITSKAATENGFIAEIMKSEPQRSIPFLKEQQDLSAMFEPEKVAHYFRSDTSELPSPPLLQRSIDKGNAVD